MKKKKNNIGPFARVIPDSRNASRDFYIPLNDAKRLFDEGKLSMDITNKAWCQSSEKFLAEIRTLRVK